MAKEFKFPDVGEGIHEGTVVKWHAKEGDKVKADITIVEVETDKAVVELPSPATGTVLKINFKEGDLVKVGQTLVVIGEEGEHVPQHEEKEVAAEAIKHAAEPAREAPGRVLATPATRKLARDKGIDLAALKGTGPGGRITTEDVEAASGTAALKPEAPVAIKMEGGDQRIPLTGIRKVIAKRMLYSKTHIPHACGMDFVDVTELVKVRKKEDAQFQDVKLTYLPFIVKAVTIALKKFPRFNSHFDEEKNEIIVKASHNIGIAVDTQDGLTVPALKNVELMSILEIAEEIKRLAVAARERKLKLDELQNGTFTITNIGSVGGMYSTPIINPPEVAIMGVHRIKDMPLVIDGQIVARKVMGLSLCFDHRVVDGAEATEFMNEVKRHLEDPDLLLVDMV